MSLIKQFQSVDRFQFVSIRQHIRQRIKYRTYIATSESLDGKVFDALLLVFCLMLLTSESVHNRSTIV